MGALNKFKAKKKNILIATEVAAPFLTPFKMTFFVALFFAMPVVLYQAWGFIAPGLYRQEKRFAFPMLASSILLFYLGISFAYYVVFPLMFGFFSAVTPEGVTMMTDISAYLNFILTLFLATTSIAITTSKTIKHLMPDYYCLPGV